MCCIGDVGLSALLKEIEIFHDSTITEGLVKRSEGGVATQNLCGQSGSLVSRGVLWKLDVVDDAVDDLILGQIDLAVALLLDVGSQVILYVALVFDV